MSPHLLNGSSNDTEHFFQREFKGINEIMTTKYGDFSNKWWLWIGSTARAWISFKPSGICHAEIYLLSHSNWKISRIGGVWRVEISVSRCWFLMLCFVYFNLFSLPLKPLISLFCSLHSTSCHSREMPGFLDSMASIAPPPKKTVTFHSGLWLSPRRLPNQRQRVFCSVWRSGPECWIKRKTLSHHFRVHWGLEGVKPPILTLLLKKVSRSLNN